MNLTASAVHMVASLTSRVLAEPSGSAAMSSRRPCTTSGRATTGFLPTRSSQCPTRPDQPSSGVCSIISATRRSAHRPHLECRDGPMAVR